MRRFSAFCLSLAGWRQAGRRQAGWRRAGWRRAAATLSAPVLALALLSAGLTMIGGPAAASARARPQFKDKGVIAYGAAAFLGSPKGQDLAAPIVGMAADPAGPGYWLVDAQGGVFAYGDAHNYGGAQSRPLSAPVARIAATPAGKGYWLVTAGGTVWPFGDAGQFGSLAPGTTPYPVVGFAPTPSGQGYWLVTSHGQVYAFGNARYYGGLGDTNLHNIPVVAIASSADGQGYWVVQGGGEVVPYGDAPRLGGMRGHPPVVGMAVTPDGRGYWLACGNGEVDSFGDAVYHGGNNKAVPRPAIAGIVADPAGGGYWLLDSEALPVTFRGRGPGGSAPSEAAAPTGEAAREARVARIVSIAASQLGPSPDGGGYCNPYGPCEEWCALFASWVWEKAGVPIPRYAFVGNLYYWAARHTAVLKGDARPAPGDLVLYGTSPRDVATSPHTGVVAQVWPDGAIDTIEGDAGPGPGGWTSVVVNGPFFASQSFFANGMPIYAFAVP